MGNADERKAGEESLGATQGSGLVPTNDSGGSGGVQGVGGSVGLEHGRLPGVSIEGEDRFLEGGGEGVASPDASASGGAGKDIGQWVIKNLRYQLAYHSSSVDWYQVEVEKCRAKIAELEAEIVRYEEAKEWHQSYLEDVQSDLAALTVTVDAEVVE